MNDRHTARRCGRPGPGRPGRTAAGCVQCDFDGTISIDGRDRHAAAAFRPPRLAGAGRRLGARRDRLARMHEGPDRAARHGARAELDAHLRHHAPSTRTSRPSCRQRSALRHAGAGGERRHRPRHPPACWRATAWATCRWSPTTWCRPASAAGSCSRRMPAPPACAPAATASASAWPNSSGTMGGCCSWATAARTSASRARPTSCSPSTGCIDHCQSRGIAHAPSPTSTRPWRAAGAGHRTQALAA